MNVFKVVSAVTGAVALGAVVVGAVKAYRKLEVTKAESKPIVVESAEVVREITQVDTNLEQGDVALDPEAAHERLDDTRQTDVEAIEAALADPHKLEQLAHRFNRGNKNHDRKRTRSGRSADSRSGD